MGREKAVASDSAQVIVAMKGHPGTGKSTLAQSIAKFLRCPLLDKDDVRDSTFLLQSSNPPNLLNSLSYDVLWRIAFTQLSLGLSLVVDSPLSRRSHLDRLLELAASSGSRLVVVECKPNDEAEWRRRLERRGCQANADAGWHKPSTWRDMERLLDGYDGCYEYDFGEVVRLVVDTTSNASFEELLSGVLEFIVSHSRPSP
ncbi:hypothetical protein RJ641_020315 [Dillenia turbinata]|uniref:Uncharacterized protein n=1 Tax=Dillenia turbinata TaxID=194707 RepID=A0AAN8YZH0_9MAGN